jgi:hypothetical protein
VGDKFSVHPESLIRASVRFSIESDHMAAAVDRLRTRLGALGDVSGADDQGRQFANGYDASVVKIEQALRT